MKQNNTILPLFCYYKNFINSNNIFLRKFKTSSINKKDSTFNKESYFNFFEIVDNKKELIYFNLDRIFSTWPIFQDEVSEIDLNRCILVQSVSYLIKYNKEYLNKLPNYAIKIFKNLEKELNILLISHKFSVKNIFNCIVILLKNILYIFFIN